MARDRLYTCEYGSAAMMVVRARDLRSARRQAAAEWGRGRADVRLATREDAAYFHSSGGTIYDSEEG